MSVAVVVGNPNANSRTLRVALAVADALTTQIPETEERLVVDVTDVAAELFDPDSQKVKDLLERVAAADLIIVASPTYKATYTGLLKSFFDRYFDNALSRAVAIPVMTGAAPIHAASPGSSSPTIARGTRGDHSDSGTLCNGTSVRRSRPRGRRLG